MSRNQRQKWKGLCEQATVITVRTQMGFNHSQKSIFPIARAISKSRNIHYKREKKGSVESSATTRNAQKEMDLNWIKVSRRDKKRTVASSKNHSSIRRIMINISRDADIKSVLRKILSMKCTANHYEYSNSIKLKWKRVLRESGFESEKTIKSKEKELKWER